MKPLLRYLAKVFYILDSSRKQLIWILLAFIASSVLEAMGIALIGPFIQIASDPNIARSHPIFQSLIFARFGVQSDAEIIAVTAVGVILMFCIKSLAYLVCRIYVYKIAYGQKVKLESTLVHTYLHIPYVFHLQRNSASLIKNIVLECNQFTRNCVLPLLGIISNSAVIVVLLILLAKTDSTLLSLSLATLMPVLILFAKLSNRVRKWGQVRSESQQKMIRAINHGLGGIKETKVIGCEQYFEQDLYKHSERVAKSAIFVEGFQVLPRISIEVLLIFFFVSLIGFSQIFWADSSEQFMSVLGIFSLASMRLVKVITQTLNAVVRMRASSYAMDMLYSDLKEIEAYSLQSTAVPIDLPPNAISAHLNNGVMMPDSHYEIILNNLTFTYPQALEPSIKTLSLSFKKGESIAFIGKSGAGKTTLVDILLGLIKPDEGDICINGTSIYGNIRSWQQQLGYIPQSIFLTDESIEKNIAFGVPPKQIDPERLQMAIEAAQLQEMIQELPDGNKTLVGERGIRLSGGQRQRIGIARALYHEREILVLDEATSALDSETEKLVSDAIHALAGSKTLIIIAHRMSTIEACDRIYMLEKGTVVRSGKFNEVVLTQ